MKQKEKWSESTRCGERWRLRQTEAQTERERKSYMIEREIDRYRVRETESVFL